MSSERHRRLHRLDVQDPISRTPGVATISLFGSQYAMRIWLDPAKLNNYG
jgi:multidrug efflux pump